MDLPSFATSPKKKQNPKMTVNSGGDPDNPRKCDEGDQPKGRARAGKPRNLTAATPARTTPKKTGATGARASPHGARTTPRTSNGTEALEAASQAEDPTTHGSQAPVAFQQRTLPKTSPDRLLP